MQVVKIIIAIILFLALQSLLPNVIPQFASSFLPRVDLTLILTVYLSLKRNPLQGTIVGATTGYSYDLISGINLLGASSFTKTVIGFTVSTINVRFAIDNKLTRLFILVGASIVNILLFLGLHYIFNSMPEGLTAPEIVKLTAWQAACNLIIGFFLFPVLDRIFVQDSYLATGRSSNW